MKRKLFLMLVLLVSTSAAWAIEEPRAISMVTYFPVPYVAYSKVDVTKDMDVGLSGVCHMSLGCVDSVNSPLHVENSVNVRNGGILNLLGTKTLEGDSITLGDTTVQNAIADIVMDKVVLQSVYNTSTEDATIPSINIRELTTDKLKLFGKEIPSCKDAHPDLKNTNQNGVIAWKALALDPDHPNKEETYLTCGAEKTCTEPKPKDEAPCVKSDLKYSVEFAEFWRLETSVLPPFVQWVLSKGVEACGMKTRDYKCDTNNFQWGPESTWSTDACVPFFPRETVPCNLLPADVRAAKNVPSGVTLEGTAKEYRYECVNGVVLGKNPSTYDTSGCYYTKYGWVEDSTFTPIIHGQSYPHGRADGNYGTVDQRGPAGWHQQGVYSYSSATGADPACGKYLCQETSRGPCSSANENSVVEVIENKNTGISIKCAVRGRRTETSPLETHYAYFTKRVCQRNRYKCQVVERVYLN